MHGICNTKKYGGSLTNNADRLDADGDGVACESLP
ncbi:excalibur calcium-binding domain-containing protein [Patescibacteria group bacterium]|nr:excalibur calcium-binding domain-containing protein [Patescibacteria group bacterium]MBU4099207.1 excalibur calcium-binding domain-containing protein [Patescibacteria group bacterium]